ncbi:hypothetical protein [Methylophaga sp. UBA2689]|uniref:hypothetical protein n=1 Tax=Methylophaga sp. UBA2689 TaxID=1946878 RepID=UPI0025D9FB08|nr:hypothetical protein [Methylophaga sp. UBA2689]|tara:strand:+ start:1547 stop:1930 length:384 start_codon:yes stop_codon:yes gene_type:complete
MYKKLFLSATVSAFLTVTSVMAEDLNHPQDNRSTINQKLESQVGQPIDNRIDSQIKQNQQNTTVNPPETEPLPTTPPSRSVITPEPPAPPSRINPKSIDPTLPENQSPQGIAPDVPDSAYPDDSSTP